MLRDPRRRVQRVVNPTPSHEDIQVTDRLTEAGKLIGISVLDHIIHDDGTGEVRSISEQ